MRNKLFLGVLIGLFIVLSSLSMSETKTITHMLGKTKIKDTPKRVIVFDHGVLDVVDSLGIDVIGVVKSTNLTDNLAKYMEDDYPSVGTLFEPNYETIIKLKPDVILIGGRQANVYGKLSKIAPTVYSGSKGINYFEDMKTRLTTLGEIFDKEELAKSKIKLLEDRLAGLNLKSNGKTAHFLLVNGTSLSVYGKGSRFDHLYSKFGFKVADPNIPASNHGNKITFEYLLDKDADYIFVLDRSKIANSKTNAREVLNNDIIKNTTAYKNDKIVYVNFPNWYLIGGGFTSTMEIIDELENSIN